VSARAFLGPKDPILSNLYCSRPDGQNHLVFGEMIPEGPIFKRKSRTKTALKLFELQNRKVKE